VGLFITSAVYPTVCSSIHQADKKEFERVCLCVRAHGQTQEISFSAISSN
jgi:hypothetical protein